MWMQRDLEVGRGLPHEMKISTKKCKYLEDFFPGYILYQYPWMDVYRFSIFVYYISSCNLLDDDCDTLEEHLLHVEHSATFKLKT